MTSSSVVVIAHVYCREDQLHEPSLAVSKWKNEEALQLHFQMEHFKQAGEQVKPFCAKPVEILKYKKLL
ncbi:unnamed protein product [Adineta ricciae]|uniref:ABM domain-containing protein n=1 Tax=Adineta ricciae TaxID=249248 RepID=A0A815DG15_ADIRI|nr:unnamed protein product [Adineta ricciae]